LGFSAKAVLIKLAYQDSSSLDALSLMMLRMVISLPFFAAVAFWSARQSNVQRLNGRDWLLIIVLGLMGYYFASLLDFEGLRYISAGLERLILFLYPTFVVLLTAATQKRPINRRQASALLLSYAGMVLVFIESLNLTPPPHLWLGSLLVLGSAITFAFFLLGSGVMIQRIGSARFTAYSMSVACLATCIHFLVQHGSTAPEQPRSVYLLALIMAIFSTVLPAFLMNAGIRRIGSSTAAILSSIGPVGTLALAFVFLNEQLTLSQGLGTVLVLIGVSVIGQKAK
jgi:drug/metabolite transporter (DMT)-like permease